MTKNKTSETSYTADDIEVLEGLAAVRKVPGMYVGATDSRGLQHMVWELADNAVDEAIAGHADTITITVHDDGSVTVTDNGRGIPTGINTKTGLSSVELVFTRLHAGGKFSGAGYKVSGGLHGVGASVVNALSRRLDVEVDQGKKTHTMSFQRGEAGVFSSTGKFTPKAGLQLKRGAKPKGTGTRVRFWPDAEIFTPDAVLDFDAICHRALTTTHLVGGLAIEVSDERTGQSRTFTPTGLDGLVKEIATDELLHEPIVFNANHSYTTTTQATAEDGETVSVTELERSMEIDVAFAWSKADGADVRAFVNIVSTTAGGTHVQGFERALTKTIGDLARQHQPKRGVAANDEIEKGDVLDGLVAVVSVKFPEPRFESQTKEKLSTPAASKLVAQAVTDGFAAFAAKRASSKVTKAIAAKVLHAARIRTQLRERKETLKRKTALSTSSLPAKLVDCHGSDFDATELILVEGDSAMGSARAARDASFQALLPLRGKVLNTWRTKEKRMLENAECAALISAMGAGAGRTFNLDDSRYSKVVIMTDADVDGSHIRALLVTFFCAYMRPLVEQGRLYAAVPPLHKIVVSGQTEPIYTVTETERADVLAELEAAGKTVKETMRFKGLGEMSANQLAGVLDPEVRTLRRINFNDELEAETMLELLMGSKVEPRRNFILEAAEAVDWDTLDL